MKDAEFREFVVEELREIRGDIKILIGFKGWVLGAACATGTIAGIIGGVLTHVLINGPK